MKIMKKILLTVLVAVVLLWGCQAIFAKDKGNGKAEGKHGASEQQVKKTPKETTPKSDVNEPSSQNKKTSKDEGDKGDGEGKKKEKHEIHEEKSKDKEQSKPNQDINEPAGKSGKGKEKDKEKAATEDTGKGRKHEQQLESLEKKIEHEQAKHLERKARLEKIRELALKDNDTKTVERVDSLINKEQQRYEGKIQRMAEKPQPKITESPADPDKKINKENMAQELGNLEKDIVQDANEK